MSPSSEGLSLRMSSATPTMRISAHSFIQSTPCISVMGACCSHMLMTENNSYNLMIVNMAGEMVTEGFQCTHQLN